MPPKKIATPTPKKIMEVTEKETIKNQHPNKKIEEKDYFIMMKDYMEKMMELVKTGFETHLQALQAEIFEMKKDQKIEKERRKKIEKENEMMKDQLHYLTMKIEEMETASEQHEQEKRNLDIVIENIDNTEVSDPCQHLRTLINKTLKGQVVDEDEIVKAVKITNKRNPKKMILIGTLKNKSTKKAILTQRKMFALQNIFAKENLTPHRHKLHMVAKKFAKENNYKFVWTRDGNVFIRKDETSRAVMLKNQASFGDL